MRSIRVAVLLGAAMSAAACASAISGGPEGIARLEKARASDPQSEAVERSLGIAYFKANRYEEARTSLQRATTLDPRDGVAALYLGLADEARNDLPGAQKAYESYLAVGKTRRVKNQIRDRLEAIRLKRIQAESRAALGRESQLAAVPGPPNTVAVMPFQFSGADTSLKPIERGFAELVTTDLSRVSRLTVLERERIQALLDELALQQNTAATGTGVRAGRILQVGRMIGGSIQQQGTQLQTSAIVTDLGTTAVNRATQDSRSIDDLFTMEKNIVLGLLQNMGVVPTTAERNAIEQRPTRSLAAFLAFSRGLEAADQGRFDDAGRQFDNALRLDPGFVPAAQKSREAKSAATGGAVTATTVESGLRGTVEGATVNAATQGTASTTGGATSVADGLNPSIAGNASTGGGSTAMQPSVDASSGTGGDNPSTKTGRVTITIKQPR